MLEKFLSQNSKVKESSDKITSISYEVACFKEKNPYEKIVDGTIGVFLGENKKPSIPESIKKLYKSFDLDTIALYGLLFPTDNFRNGVFYLNNIDKQYQDDISVFPTTGGLNALASFVHNFVDDQSQVFIFSPYWGPYENLFFEIGLEFSTIDMKPSSSFKIDKDYVFSEINDKLRDKNIKNLIFLINFPAHNPTGVTFDDEELSSIQNVISKLKSCGHEILLVFDLVYLHFSFVDINRIFEIFNDFPFFFNFSLSKTLSLYGFRTGALCYYSREASDKELFQTKLSFTARALTGSINHSGYKIVETIGRDFDLDEKKKLTENWDNIKQVMKKRWEKIKDILNKHGFQYYRHDEGFFVSFFHDNFDVEKLYNTLKENGLFFILQKDSIRMAISSMNTEDIEIFEKKINRLF
jgi:aromatic-amino-acid transaminase